MELTAWLAWLTLVVGVPLNVLATLLLLKKHRQAPYLRVLRERGIASIVTTGVVLFFGLIFVNNDQPVPPLDLETTKWITRLTILGLAVIPAAGWIWLYRSTRRKGKTMKTIAAICLGLSVLCFVLHALGLQVRVSLVWLAVAFLVAGVYFFPVAFVAFK